MPRGVSHDPKQLLKLVLGQKWKSDIFHFLNKKDGLTSYYILRNNPLYICNKCIILLSIKKNKNQKKKAKS